MSLLQPKKLKYRKYRKGRTRGKASNGYTIAFGKWGLKVLEPARISARQIEACRLTIIRALPSSAKLWVRIFPHRPVTKKPAETRMGGGKGDVVGYEARVKAGTILFELDGVSEKDAMHALKLAADKIQYDTKIVSKNPWVEIEQKL
ncbi:MAG: 50S ribosomal protein L16 [Candidatus Calescibacterium sp.]|nr:50S ribosomal protein L16 [Candidatus Calescibacterium sp.]MDW8087879.1 50S ribosomal protein L16 [Candidatus Calescibacterium sp.]